MFAEPFEMTKEASVEFMSESPLQPGPGVMFTIADDGPGIRPELLSKLFDPYVSSKAIGRGLGLATVRTIVETHGGGLKVESELGKGTVFSVFLPKAKLPAPSAPEKASQEEDEIRKMFKDQSYDAFLAKPFTIAELKTKLTSLRSA